MDHSNSDASVRFGGVAGIVFAVGMVVIGFAVYFTQPVFTDSVAEIREHFADNETTREVADWAAAFLFVFGFLIFASALRSALRADDREGTWSRVSFAGAIASVAVAGSGVFLGTFTLGEMDELSDSVVQAFMRADALVYGVLLPWGFALFLTGASFAMLRSRMFAQWLAWFGLGTAAALAVGALWPIDGDPEGALAIIGIIGFLAALLWVVLAGIRMARTES